MDMGEVDVMTTDMELIEVGIEDDGIVEGFVYDDARRQRSVWKGLLAGLAGGLAASWTMNQFQAAMQKVTEGNGNGQSQPEQRKAGDATVKAASAVSETIAHHTLTHDEKRVAGPIVHYVFGSAIGALYGAAAEFSPMTAKGWGVPFGAAVFVGADEIGVPLAGLSDPPNKVPASTHASALAAHLVYGATTDGVRRIVRAVLK
jgi:uncharacterized membrane protein YagU involved in acid resistance